MPIRSKAILILVFSISFLPVAVFAQSFSTSPSSSYAKALVERHNFWRKEVGVGPVTWSEKLSRSALSWAKTLKKRGCGFEHSSTPYGENLFMGTVGYYNAIDAVDSWGEEKEDYNAENNTCAPGAVCGHYTQVVWEKSTHIGCAEVECDGNLIVVCQYDPPGNYIGQRPFPLNGGNTHPRASNETSTPGQDIDQSPEQYANAVVKRHNYWRGQVGVSPIKWSDALAKSAAVWANTLKKRGCAFQHSQGEYGENLFMGTVGYYTTIDAIDNWASEKENYNIRKNKCDPGKMCGHYTQIVWEKSTEVGCVEIECDGNLIVVCQYNPPGNYVGERPYDP